MSSFSIANLLVWYVVFLFSTTFHEFAHSIVAYWGGDRTAYDGGQVSLDPLPHIQRAPFGLVVVPLLSFYFLGWMIGWASAPYDPQWARRDPKKYAFMSFAGPAANLLLAAVAFGIMRVCLGAGVLEFSSGPLSLSALVSAPGQEAARSPLGALAMALSVLLCLNVLLGVFNLLPIPPLDGAAVLEGLFPRQLRNFFEAIRTSRGYQFLGMVVAWKLFPFIAYPVLSVVVQAL